MFAIVVITNQLPTSVERFQTFASYRVQLKYPKYLHSKHRNLLLYTSWQWGYLSDKDLVIVFNNCSPPLRTPRQCS